MGLLSPTVSMTRYRVQGKIDSNLIDTVTEALKKNTISEIDYDGSDMAVGWTSIENPYSPDFEGSSFVIGPYMVFSLRIDKKSVSAKIVKKHLTIAMSKKLQESDRDFLSRNEKQVLKEQVMDDLILKIPATPNVYDLIWNYEESELWYFSNQTAANEELETLFSKSFKMTLVRLFPYTMGDLNSGLTDKERDRLNKLTPSKFTE